MAIVKDGGRQWPLTAKVNFTFADADGVSVELIDIPGGAVVTGGAVVIVNAFDSASSAVLDLGDKTTGDKYAANVDAKVAGGTNLVPAGAAFSVTDALVLNITNTGTPTVGDGYVLVSYIVGGRANEVQPV